MKESTWILKSFASVKGINDMPIAQVVTGYLTLAQFNSKTAERRAKTWKRKYDAGLTPNL